MGRTIIFAVTLLVVLFGPCAPAVIDSLRDATPTAEASPEFSTPVHVSGYAHGLKWRCGGKFNWRGQYIGPYCVEVPVTTEGAYLKNGRYYMPALTMNHEPKGWWIRVGYGGSWRNSVVQ